MTDTPTHPFKVPFLVYKRPGYDQHIGQMYRSVLVMSWVNIFNWDRFCLKKISGQKQPFKSGVLNCAGMCPIFFEVLPHTSTLQQLDPPSHIIWMAKSTLVIVNFATVFEDWYQMSKAAWRIYTGARFNLMEPKSQMAAGWNGKGLFNWNRIDF